MCFRLGIECQYQLKCFHSIAARRIDVMAKDVKKRLSQRLKGYLNKGWSDSNHCYLRVSRTAEAKGIIILIICLHLTISPVHSFVCFSFFLPWQTKRPAKLMLNVLGSVAVPVGKSSTLIRCNVCPHFLRCFPSLNFLKNVIKSYGSLLQLCHVSKILPNKKYRKCISIKLYQATQHFLTPRMALSTVVVSVQAYHFLHIKMLSWL